MNPSFDKVRALDQIGGDHELLAEVAQLFIEDCPQMRKDAREAIADGDLGKLKSAAQKVAAAIVASVQHNVRFGHAVLGNG